MKRNYTYRPLLFGHTEFPHVEKWLENMSEKGLHAARVGSNLVKFEKGHPEKRAYKFEYLEDGFTPERQEFYDSFGWTHVNRCRDSHHLFTAPKNAGYVPLHTDAEEESRYLLKYYHSLKWRTAGLLLLFLLMFFMKLSVAGSYAGFIHFLSKNVTTSDLPIFYPLIFAVMNMISALKIRKRALFLSEGQKPAETDGSWASARRKNVVSIGSFIFSLLLFVFLLPGEGGMSNGYYNQGDEYYYSLPALTIKDLDADEDTSLLANTRRTFGAKKVYTLFSSPDDERIHPHYVDTILYEMRLGFLTKPLVHELASRDHSSFHKVTDTRLDALFMRKENGRISLVGSMGRTVMDMTYKGSLAEDTLIARFEEKLHTGERRR